MYMYMYVSYVGLGGPTGSREGGSRYVRIMHPNGGQEESYGRCDAYHHYDRICTLFYTLFYVCYIYNNKFGQRMRIPKENDVIR